MTASDPTPSARDDDGARSIAARALDVLVYLPAGAVLTALEDVPDTVAKGRARVDQELRNAKIVGRFAVDVGLRQLKEQIDWIGAERAGPAAARHDGGPGPRPAAGRERRQAAPAAAGRPRPATPARDPEVDRAIPDYDILAASQVVRRLDGLGHDELRAVVRHERATRARRTILHRAEQLLGTVARDPGAGSTA